MRVFRALALGLLVVFALLLVNSRAWPQVADVPKWSVHEIALTSDKSYTNPYTQISVTATFQGSGEIKKTVEGFWDGDRTFIVRFTPTVQGKWKYTTSSRDPGLNAKTGTFNCIAPRSQDLIQYGVRNKRYSEGDEWGNAGILYNLSHNMPVVNDEYGYIGEYI